MEAEILETHDDNMRAFDNRLRGLEQASNILSYHEQFLQHILQASNHSFQLLDKLFMRLKNMQRYISFVLEARETICIDLTCFDSKGLHLGVNSKGLSIFIRGHVLSATAGKTPSCSMNSRQEISIHHMKHMEEINGTHLKYKDEVVKIECLTDYALCPKEDNVRKIANNDLIEKNLLLSPGKKESYKIQCLQAEVLETPTGYIRCSMLPQVVSLPLTTTSGVTIGLQDLKLVPYNSPLTTLKEVGMNLFKSSTIKLAEAKTLAHKTWSKLTDVSKVNSHHFSALAATIICFVAMVVCLLCYQCCCFDCAKWCRAKREGHHVEWESVRWWRKKTSSNSTDEDVELENPEKESPDHSAEIPSAPAEVSILPTADSGTLPAGRSSRVYLDLGSFARTNQ